MSFPARSPCDGCILAESFSVLLVSPGSGSVFTPLSFRFSAISSSGETPSQVIIFPYLLITLNKEHSVTQVEMFQNLIHVEWISVLLVLFFFFNSRSLLVVYFKYSIVYMSIPNSVSIPSSPPWQCGWTWKLSSLVK